MTELWQCNVCKRGRVHYKLAIVGSRWQLLAGTVLAVLLGMYALISIACSTLALYLLCYGGMRGPIDWLMCQRAHHGRRDDHDKPIALTFDDGPHATHTPALLAALAELNVKATFFLVGSKVDANPQLARQIAQAGHEIGNHTYRHLYLPAHTGDTVLRELQQTDRAIARVTGVIPTLVRPPYGARSPLTLRAFAAAGKQVALWDVNSWDWKGHSAAVISQQVIERAQPGSVVLMHDVGPNGAATVDAVKLIVARLRSRGYCFRSVSEVLATTSL
jgi:peptidoglycan-N-acetylglucosamine deacetylase